jgi:hypothetical protein
MFNFIFTNKAVEVIKIVTMKATKYILPVVVGAIAGMLLIKVGENQLEKLYPLPAGIDNNNIDALATAIAAMPKAAFELLLLNYAISSFVAGLAATLMAGRTFARPAVIVGIILTLGGLFNVITFPKQPIWFSVSNLLVYLPLAVIGYLAGRKAPAVGPSDSQQQR